ncbi:MAG: hypothetical protein LVQ75_03000 [Candidatus Babeliales bacterium]
MLDRIDLQIHVPSVDYETATNKEFTGKSSESMKAEVDRAVALQQERFNNIQGANGTMSAHDIEQHCQLTPAAEAIIKKVFDQLHLSMRGYHKVLKVARTIADLDNCIIIDTQHIKEALMYRSLDKYLKNNKNEIYHVKKISITYVHQS